MNYYAKPLISGFTTNPAPMHKAGIADYEAFARDILAAIPDRPFSLEAFAGEFSEMERQAHLIASWGKNAYVKIPVTNTRREPSLDLIRRLASGILKRRHLLGKDLAVYSLETVQMFYDGARKPGFSI
jgi:transaldolase